MDKVENITHFVKFKGNIESNLFLFVVLFGSFIIGILIILFFIFWIRKMSRNRKRENDITAPIQLSPLENTILLYLDKVKGYHQIVRLSDESCLFFSVYGIFFFYITEHQGLLEGSYQDEWLRVKGSSVPIHNPFWEMRQLYPKLVLKETVQKILIVPNPCYLKVTDYVHEIVVKEGNLLLTLDKMMGFKMQYTKEDVDAFYSTYSVN